MGTVRLSGMSYLLLALGLTFPAPDSVPPGPCSRAAVEATGHFAPAEAGLTAEHAAELGRALAGTRLELYLGTWCDDSREQVPRLWATLDAAGFAYGEDAWRQVCVDETKTEPADAVTARGIEFVPTLVVWRGERELGRVVETPVEGWAADLLGLLAR
jgi:hypothetical protein